MLYGGPPMAYMVGPWKPFGCIHPVRGVLAVLVHGERFWSPMGSLKHRGLSCALPLSTHGTNHRLQAIAKIDCCEARPVRVAL